MKFSRYTVTAAGGPINFFAGTIVRLDAAQYRRRRLALAEVSKDGDGHYVGTIKTRVTFKAGETFEVAGDLPKAFFGVVSAEPGGETLADLAFMARRPAKKSKRKASKASATADQDDAVTADQGDAVTADQGDAVEALI